jgi:hypothetical protein
MADATAKRMHWIVLGIVSAAVLLIGIGLFLLVDGQGKPGYERDVRIRAAEDVRTRAAEMVLAWLLGQSPESSRITVSREEDGLETIAHLKAANRIAVASPCITELHKFKDSRLVAAPAIDHDAVRRLSAKDTVGVMIVPDTVNLDDVNLVVVIFYKGKRVETYRVRVRDHDGDILIHMAAVIS